MTSTINSEETDREVTRHPIRGGLWGVLLGLSLAMYAVLFSLVPFSDWVPLALVVLLGVALGVAWAYLAPAKQPKTKQPAPRQAGADAATPTSAQPDGVTPGDA